MSDIDTSQAMLRPPAQDAAQQLGAFAFAALAFGLMLTFFRIHMQSLDKKQQMREDAQRKATLLALGCDASLVDKASNEAEEDDDQSGYAFSRSATDIMYFAGNGSASGLEHRTRSPSPRPSVEYNLARELRASLDETSKVDMLVKSVDYDLAQLRHRDARRVTAVLGQQLRS